MARAIPAGLAAALSCLPLWASAKPGPVPDRRIPPSVLGELRALDTRLETALYADCPPERCFPKGCAYGDHAVADQPRTTALPGLAEEKGPGSLTPQEYLTLARCSFAYEADLGAKSARRLSKRIQIKLSTGYTRVVVNAQRLEPLDLELPLPPTAEPEDAEEEPVVEEPGPQEVWTLPVAGRELWLALLPHFSWMIAIVLFTLSAFLLLWAWRSLGRLSPEEQLLLAQAQQGAGTTDRAEDDWSAEGVDLPPSPAEGSDTFVAEQQVYWQDRLSAAKDQPDPDLRALVETWLRENEQGLLAKAVMTYPEAFTPAFPEGGDLAKAKLTFSDYLREVDSNELPSDEDFYARLRQHALSAAVGRQSDAKGIASLRDEFGATGLVSTIRTLNPRMGAILFAHASMEDQMESARLLQTREVIEVAEQLLLSNRMSQKEADRLITNLAGGSDAAPARPSSEVSDRGTLFDAEGALSILLGVLPSPARDQLLTGAMARFGGQFPSWYRGLLWPQLVLRLDESLRANLLFDVDVRPLAAWISIQSAETRQAVLGSAPPSLRAAIEGATDFGTRGEQLRAASEGRRALAAALHRRLVRTSTTFESLVP